VRYVTDEEYIENAKDEAAREALRELNAHLISHQVTVNMKAGEILFFDNRRLLHGRAARLPGTLPPQDQWRWQRRMHCTTDLDRLQQPGLPRRMVNTDDVYQFKYTQTT
jgi:alpha-ketoglutarate-dependent taurine dioxygenase